MTLDADNVIQYMRDTGGWVELEVSIWATSFGNFYFYNTELACPRAEGEVITRVKLTVSEASYYKDT